MWPFTKRYSLLDSEVFEGFTDYHSHLLHGVDDGACTLDDSLELLAVYEFLKIRTVCLTPHVAEDTPNTTESLRERFRQLKDAYTGTIDLRLSAEYMLDNLFEERLAADDLLPLGDGGNHLLVETSYFRPPQGMYERLERILSKGYHPVLAHPERYFYMTGKEYRRLKEMQVKFQMNVTSLSGNYGPEVREKARMLLCGGMIDLLGSDTHDLQRFLGAIVRKSLKAKETYNSAYSLRALKQGQAFRI